MVAGDGRVLTPRPCQEPAHGGSVAPGQMIEYRPAQPLDAESIATLHARSWREHYRGNLPDHFLDGNLLDDRRCVWRARLDQPAADQFVLIAAEADDLLGFICVYANHDPRWGSLIDNLHIATARKRRRIGTALMRRAGAWLASTYPPKGVYLWVWEANLSARRFYERLGACNAGVMTMAVHGGDASPICRYVWQGPQALASADNDDRTGAAATDT